MWHLENPLVTECTSYSTQLHGTWNSCLADFHSGKPGPHEGPYAVAKVTPWLIKASVILAPDVFIVHREANRVLSMAVSIGGMAHLRDVMNKAPAEVAHLEKAGWKELLLRGV